MRNTSTKTRDERKAAAADRRKQARELARRLAALPADMRAALLSKVGGLVTIQGRRLSPGNMMLVAYQLPGATVVGGFRQWLAAGRCVRKGEHGAAIWVPCGAGKASSAADFDDDDAGGGGSDGCKFICATVFDISQTDAIQRRDSRPGQLELIGGEG